MRRVLSLSVLILLLSCSDEKKRSETQDPSRPGDEGGERDADSDETAQEPEEDEDAAQEESSAEDAGKASDSGAPAADAAQTQRDAATQSDTGSSVDASAILDASASIDAATNVADAGLDAADSDSASSEAAADGAAASREAGADEVACIDEQIAALTLFDAPATGAITEEGAAPAFATHIDATGGAVAGSTAATQSFVYGRFTENGLEKVAVGDEAAFASTAWHIAARRFVLRVNSGVSGPGTVRAARTAPGTTFEGLSAVPDGLSYRSEQYFTESCEFVPDTSGINAPATALSSFWSYPGCVKMTRNVFVLELPGGRHIKLQVTGFYPPANQQLCDETNAINFPSGAGNLRIRWSFLD